VRVQAHDVNGDGKCDLVAVNGVQGAWTFLGNAGSFNTASPLGGAPSASAALAVADLTSDGLPDVVVGNAAAASLEVFVQSPSPTTGISLYGTGTPGCAGALGVGANTTSHVNTPGLAFTCTNAPARALGLGLITNAQDLTGSDPFFLGIFLHVDLFTTTELLALDFVSDPQGNGFVPAPTPNIPALAGLTFYFQGIWIESVPSGQACSPSPFHLTSTRGLAVTVQP
jgi:hypothetical protein